eukprot:CAMPEP_0171858876 /NCGR_PEP_ID=MMETSP0992-20121227/25560_1 /TAXON_ID=483369 /ORGANISM="non described non described, Strain CCMP2098" /LENGTH=179 /DNA_ID=CAMNT_0012480415 /DNA_START=24 /DNA_END=563 /DNA_ORIENTATION=-
MPPRSTGSSTSKIVFMVLGIVAFGAGLFRGFYEPQLPASAIAHTGEATLKGGPHSLTEMETTLARQQRMIEELLENQKEQKELLKVQQQQQQHAEAFMAATDGDDEPSEEEDKQQLEEVGGEDDFDATKKKKKKKRRTLTSGLPVAVAVADVVGVLVRPSRSQNSTSFLLSRLRLALPL